MITPADRHQRETTAGPAAAAMATARPAPFDTPVPRDGYRWWYLDATDAASDRALVIIVFVGSVFSPYYYRARQRGAGDPENFCAINVALYGPGSRKHWAMTERRAGNIERSANEYRLGPSRVRWQQGQLQFDINERCVPLGQALRGRVSVTPLLTHGGVYTLDAQQRHQWTPWAPQGRAHVEFDQPGCRWQGEAYMDANAGAEPLEAAFLGWDWSRCRRDTGTELHYQVYGRDGTRSGLSMLIDAGGRAHQQAAKPSQKLPRALWGVPRRVAGGADASLVHTLEDTPFYTRNLLHEQTAAGPLELVHESLSMERFKQAWVRTLLPFRMPREWPAGGTGKPHKTPGR